MRISTLAAIAVLSGSAAAAQDIYAGVGFDFGNPSSGDSQTVASLMIGSSFDAGSMTIGIEGEYGAAATFGGDYDTARLRLLGGFDMDGFTAIGSVGSTQHSTNAGKVNGYNLGVGVQVPVNSALNVRGEILHDVMEGSAANATTSRIAAIYSF